MANAGWEVRVMDDIHSEEEEFVDPNVGGGNNDEEVQEVNPKANNVTRGHNDPRRGNREEYYNESDFQNKVIQLVLPLSATPTLRASAGAKKEE
ncbi:hypothetical protein ACSBR2_015181 [Camellia fascicularis]